MPIRKPTHRRSARIRAARIARLAAVPALLAALAACDDATEPRIDTTPSSMRYEFSGTGPQGRVDGIHEITGDPDPAAPLLRQTFALGHRYREEGAVEVIANRAGNAGLADSFTLGITRLTEGTSAVEAGCDGEFCTEVRLGLGLSTTTASQAQYSCFLQTGTVRISDIGDGRVRGSFSGAGRCVGAPGTEDLEEFRISNGVFNVKLVDARI